MQKLRIVIGGFLGILPAGGVTWDYIQYPIGFSLMGHDVYYIEDTRLYPIYQQPGSNWEDSSACVNHLSRVMEYFGLNDRWAYRDEASGNCFGMSASRILEICRTADVFINVSCSTYMREEYLRIPIRVLIDSDPMFTQIQYMSTQMFTPGETGLRQMINSHNFLFTFGENINADDCRIPLGGLQWNTTRQPVCLQYWKSAPYRNGGAAQFTTLMNWSAGKKLNYDNEEWGQKNIEQWKILPLPKRVNNVRLAMVLSQTNGSDLSNDQQALIDAGWDILQPEICAPDWLTYQGFIEQSFGEFSVAKETYVKGKTGWFSCRSACYLASGRPVITQDTGWSKYIPNEMGLLSFYDLETAAAAIEDVMSAPHKHAKVARIIAEEYFDSKKVLSRLLDKIS